MGGKHALVFLLQNEGGKEAIPMAMLSEQQTPLSHDGYDETLNRMRYTDEDMDLSDRAATRINYEDTRDMKYTM